MLLDSKLKKNLGDSEAILIAVYLKNKSLDKILKKMPFEG